MFFPKVLIFGQPFNNFSGGGITLTNLFKGWPKDKIAVAFIGHGLLTVSTDICETYYQLGREEHKWIFPFNIINRDFPSGLKSNVKNSSTPINTIQKGSRYFIVNRFFYPFLKWIGLFHCASSISLSKKMKDWLSEFHPEILYLQVSSRETLRFAGELADYLKIPSAIHVMDDWVSIVSTSGILKNYWHRIINSEFSQLMDKTEIHMSISEAMSEEYMKRYNKKFIPFHNPIEVDNWIKSCKADFTVNRKGVIILHSGRLGIGITDSLADVASAIDNFKNDQFHIKLHIQTPSKDKNTLDRLQRYRCVVINPFADYSKLPEIFSKADILLLANEFNTEGISYLKYSMPTKASEYMISGTPVLVYAPESSAVSRLFRENNCGVCVIRQKEGDIMNAIHLMLEDIELRKEISKNAVNFAKSNFDVVKVRNGFHNLLKDISLISKTKSNE